MTHKPEMLDELLKDCKTPKDVESLYSQLLQRMINRSLDAEMDVHLRGNRGRVTIKSSLNACAAPNFPAWAYDTAANGLGQLASVQETTTGYIKVVEYDSLGRPSKIVTSLGVGGADGNHYEKVTYDQFGRTFQSFDAARNDDSFTGRSLATITG
jgi:hypothetical protein